MEKNGPKDEVRINGRFAYAIKHKPPEAGREKTDAYVDDRRMLDGRFPTNGFREAIGANSPGPKSRLRSLIATPQKS